MTKPRIELDQLLPHSAKMLMLSEVTSSDEQSIRCRCTIKADNPLLVDGMLPMLAGIELFAQTAGVFFGLRHNKTASQPTNRGGAVVQLKSFNVLEQSVPVGAELMIEARYLAGSADAIMMEGQIEFKGRQVFTGRLMIALFTQENHDA